MKKNLKTLEQQLVKLDQDFHRNHDPNLMFDVGVSQDVRDDLAPNERVVEDHFQNADGETVITLGRVTANPSDMGKDFAHGSWDRDRLYARFRHTIINGISWERPQRVIPAIQMLKPEEPIVAPESLDSILASEEE
jgi:hypothetical protein